MSIPDLSTRAIANVGRGLVVVAWSLLLFMHSEVGAQTAALLDLSRAAQIANDDELRIEIAPPHSGEAREALTARWMAYPSIAWNELALQSIEKYRLNPLRAARLLAHLHAALHDAWVQCAHAQAGSRCARIAQHVAGGRVMQHFLPEEAPGRFIALATSALASMDVRPASSEDRDALHRGKTAAWGAVLRAFADGADRALTAPRRPPPQPGVWRPTPPLFAINPAEQGAPRWRTWVLRSGDEVQPPPPLAYGSAAYVAEVREVLDVTRQLTKAQKKIAEDWNLDLGTATPPGVWNRHAMRFIRERRLEMEPATQLLTEMNLAMFDAMVACWTAKMKWWTERPVTEVRERFDPLFVPHVSTPPFPGYVSGHSSASGAAAYVLGVRIPAIRDETLAMANEAAMSRLYGGIHLRNDNEEGLKLGLEVGRRTIERFDSNAARKDQLANK